ncbi:MAG TPA: hypothetical protein VNH11_04650 [Pirellulales bacterium]|nr:hypothetical protein [Pirellulales bacterium]
MIRREPSRRKRDKRAVKKPGQKRSEQTISETLAELDRVETASPKAKPLIDLFRDWLTDESGYDEETWPKLKNALNRERARVGARRLFDA